MADTIDIRFNITGAEEGAQATEQLAQSTQHLSDTVGSPSDPQSLTGLVGAFVEGLTQIDDAERDAIRQQRAFVHNVGEMAQGVQAAATTVEQLARGIGSGSTARAASLVGSMASGAASGAAMGMALGPVGAGLGAVIGGLTPAILALGEGVNSAALNMDYMTERAERSVEPLRHMGEAADEAADAYRRISEYLVSIDEFVPEWATGGGIAGPASLSETFRRFGLSGDDNEPRRDGRARPREEPRAAMTEDALAEFTDINSPEETARRAEADAEYAAQAEELANEEIERLAREGDAQAELFELKADLREADMEAEREKQDYLRELEEQAAEAREQELEGVMQMVGRSSKMLFTAIAQVASGAKSGEEAFLGLLKSFLEMISEYASLKAATEFADAAGAFARYDYGGGAAHVGAGLAFTAVAVATGVGAAAIGSGAPQAPARPEAQPQGQEGGGNTTYVVNWNSPVVTAGTRAELGRDLVGLMSEAEAA